MDIIHEAAHEDANIIVGAVVNERMSDEIKITVIATGFDKAASSTVPVHTGPIGGGPGSGTSSGKVNQDDTSIPAFIRKKAD